MECREYMKRKNILFIMADQMAAPMLPIYASSPIKMPNLSRLAAEGVVFDAAYCNSPLCAPSRFTLVSGQLPSKIGADLRPVPAPTRLSHCAVGQNAFLRA
jgi:choline-sulfatase